MASHYFIKTPLSIPQEHKPKVNKVDPPPLAPYLPSFILTPSIKSHQNTMLQNQQTKNDFIDRLVETTVEIIDSIWQQQQQQHCHMSYSKMVGYQHKHQEIKVVSTRAFIQEILRRSKTTYSNLQVCLFYLFRVKKTVVMRLNEIETHGGKESKDEHMISCGRRMFLASLMLASKFLQDKNYRNRAWSRISGLALREINAAELAFLKLINYNLYISKDTFDRWYSLLHSYLYREPSTICHYPTSHCTLCYTSPPPPSPTSPPPLQQQQQQQHTSLCIICCNQCVLPSRFQHQSSSYYYERFSSIKLAYPSPPSDEMNSAPLVTTHNRYKRYGNMDDDQDHQPIKRCCI